MQSRKATQEKKIVCLNNLSSLQGGKNKLPIHVTERDFSKVLQ